MPKCQPQMMQLLVVNILDGQNCKTTKPARQDYCGDTMAIIDARNIICHVDAGATSTNIFVSESIIVRVL